MTDAICYNCKHFKGTTGGYGHCDVYYDTTVHWQGKVCCYFKQEYDDLKEEREDTSMAKDFLEEHFVKGAKSCYGPQEVLNWYRNLYYKEDENSERRIVAEAINDFFTKALPQLLKEVKLVAADTIDSYVYVDLRKAEDTRFLYEDVILPDIERFKNEVKNDKV